MSSLSDDILSFLKAAGAIERLVSQLHAMAEETGHSELSTIGNAILEKPELAAGVVGAVQSAVNGHLEDAATNLGESVGSYDGGDG